MDREFDDEKLNVLLEDQEWDGLLEEDDDFDAAVKEEYIKEAEEIEKSLFPEGIPSMSDVSMEETRASYEKLVELMRRKGIYREDAPADGAVGTADGRDTMAFAGNGMAFIPNGNGTVGLRIGPRTDAVHERRRAIFSHCKVVRAAGFGAACLLGVFLASMTSEANRVYFVRTVRYLTGNDAYVVVNNDENDKSLREETQIRKIIEKTLGVKIPELNYRPESFEYCDYDIQEDAVTASIEYFYNDTIIELYISNDISGAISQHFNMDGNGQTTFYIENSSIQVTMTENFDEREEIPSYSAQWQKGSVLYLFSGRMEKDIFQRIVENMTF